MTNRVWPEGLEKPGRSDWALFLDFDGTLVDIAPRPDAIAVRDGLADLIVKLHTLSGGAVAVVSGRPVSQIEHHLGRAEFAIAGLHGAELRHDGVLERMPADPLLEQVRARLGLFADEHGLLMEDKGASIALHYRDKPDLEEAVRSEVDNTLLNVQADTLHALHGKCVVEVRAHHANKGSILVKLMTDPAFAGRAPVFIGDDVTDEDGMRMALELGGHAIKVGAGDSVAPHRLADPEAVAAFLAGLADHWESLE